MPVKSIITIFSLFLTTAAIADGIEFPAEPKDGDTHVIDARSGDFRVWDAVNKQWVEPVQFWLNFAARRGGLTWGRTDTYPEYDKVKEHDTLIIETPAGSCLMYFFHTRWRRAWDVWRWGPELKEYDGCKDVFKY